MYYRHYPWYRVYDFIRYNFPAFIKNLIVFRKLLWYHRSYDAHYTILALKTSLEIRQRGMATDSHPGHVGDEKRQEKMVRAIELLDNAYRDRYIELAEKELGAEVRLGLWVCQGYKTGAGNDGDVITNSKIFALARELEEKQWDELFEILKGQDYTKFKSPSDDFDGQEEDFQQWFDGSGLKGWWH